MCVTKVKRTTSDVSSQVRFAQASIEVYLPHWSWAALLWVSVHGVHAAVMVHSSMTKPIFRMNSLS